MFIGSFYLILSVLGVYSGNMNIGIFGSCISRDIFREMKLDNLVKEYRARTSIHSVTQSVSADVSKINLPESKFQSKMVLSDFNKTELNLADCDFLILDLIDERFELITNFGSVVTLSNELKDNNDISPKLNYLDRGSEIDFSLWRAAVKKFGNMIKIPIILHKSRLSNVLNHEADNLVINHQYIETMNQKLITYEKILYEELEIVGTIDVKQDLLVSDINHIWGYSPYHYIFEYYEEALRQLFEITNTDKRIKIDTNRFEIELERKNGEFITKINGDVEDLSFAFYVSVDNEIVHKEWYSPTPSYTYLDNHPKSAKLSVKVFIKNMFNEIRTMTSDESS